MHLPVRAPPHEGLRSSGYKTTERRSPKARGAALVPFVLFSQAKGSVPGAGKLGAKAAPAYKAPSQLARG